MEVARAVPPLPCPPPGWRVRLRALGVSGLWCPRGGPPAQAALRRPTGAQQERETVRPHVALTWASCSGSDTCPASSSFPCATARWLHPKTDCVCFPEEAAAAETALGGRRRWLWGFMGFRGFVQRTTPGSQGGCWVVWVTDPLEGAWGSPHRSEPADTPEK